MSQIIKGFGTAKYSIVPVFNKSGFVIEDLKQHLCTEVFRDGPGLLAYEALKDSFDCNKEIFNKTCEMNFH